MESNLISLLKKTANLNEHDLELLHIYQLPNLIRISNICQRFEKKICPYELDLFVHQNISNIAAWFGDTECLCWAKKMNCFFDKQTSLFAVMNNQLECLLWFDMNQITIHELICDYAASYGHLEILKWARAKNFQWSAQTCANAANNGHLSTFIWLRENGCDWDDRICNTKYSECLQWAIQHGCPINTDKIIFNHQPTIDIIDCIDTMQMHDAYENIQMEHIHCYFCDFVWFGIESLMDTFKIGCYLKQNTLFHSECTMNKNELCSYNIYCCNCCI